MADIPFAAILAGINEALDTAPANVGLKVSPAIYSDMRARGLIKPKEADFIHWKFVMPGYRDHFVYDDPDLGEYDYKVGQANA